MPVGPYADWDECIRKNQDKDDPERYCGALERESRGSMSSTHVALMAPEEVLTSDRRLFTAGAWRWREEFALQYTDTTSDGHDGAQFVGNVSNSRRETINSQTWIVADVTYATDARDSETRQRAEAAMEMADTGRIAGVSVDYSPQDFELIITETDDQGVPVKDELHVSDAEIVGLTQLPMPAFGGARIISRAEYEAMRADAVTAAANPKAKRDWFADPQLPGPTPLTVTDDGRVFGHLATWGTCHIGFDGVCVTPPQSETSYKFFNLGAVSIDGQEIPCGHITLGTGHAQLNADAQAATEHYDHTGSVAADVAAGEDVHGIWVAGAVRPGVDLDVLRSASLSGDWRRVDGNLELVAALAVNVPGFPVPRIAASIAGGDQQTLVASGVVERRDREDLIYEALRLLSVKIDALAAKDEPPYKGLRQMTTTKIETNEETLERTRPVETAMGRIAALLDTSTG